MQNSLKIRRESHERVNIDGALNSLAIANKFILSNDLEQYNNPKNKNAESFDSQALDNNSQMIRKQPEKIVNVKTSKQNDPEPVLNPFEAKKNQESTNGNEIISTPFDQKNLNIITCPFCWQKLSIPKEANFFQCCYCYQIENVNQLLQSQPQVIMQQSSQAQILKSQPQISNSQAHFQQTQIHPPQTQAHISQQQAHISQQQAHISQQQAHIPQQQAYIPQQQAHIPQQQSNIFICGACKSRVGYSLTTNYVKCPICLTVNFVEIPNTQSTPMNDSNSRETQREEAKQAESDNTCNRIYEQLDEEKSPNHSNDEDSQPKQNQHEPNSTENQALQNKNQPFTITATSIPVQNSQSNIQPPLPNYFQSPQLIQPMMQPQIIYLNNGYMPQVPIAFNTPNIIQYIPIPQQHQQQITSNTMSTRGVNGIVAGGAGVNHPNLNQSISISQSQNNTLSRSNTTTKRKEIE